MVQIKRILFSGGLGAVALIILIVIINPLEFDFNEFGVKFTGLFAGDSTSEETEPLEETTSVETTTSAPTTSISTTTAPATTAPEATTSTSTTTTVPDVDHVVFSEVLYNPSGSESDEEWIELYNPRSNSVDISGFTIEDNGGTYTIPDGTSIDDGEYLVIARNGTRFEELYGDSPDLDDLGLSLSNGKDYLKLIDDDDDEIDMVAWEGKDEWDLEVENGESIERYPKDKDTDSDNDWRVNDDPDPDTGGLITTSTTTTTTSTTTSTTTTTTTAIPILPSLSVSVTAKIDTIVRGNDQTIITGVTNGTDPIEGALVNVTVTYASGTPYSWCSDLTNSTGIFICTYTIGGGSIPGIFTATSTASKEGYESGIGSIEFDVTNSTGP